MIIHLIPNCQLGRSIWFGSKWHIQIENMDIRSDVELVMWFLDPNHISGEEKAFRWEFCLFASFLCDKIWQAYNEAFHQGKQLTAFWFSSALIYVRSMGGGTGLGLQANTNLDRDGLPHNTPIVKFLSSYDEGSRCADITKTPTSFPQLKLIRE